MQGVGRAAGILGATAAVVAALAIPSIAAAEPLADVAVGFGDPPQPTTIAGDREIYDITFTAGAPLSSADGSTITIDTEDPSLAPGTQFPASGYTVAVGAENRYVPSLATYPDDDPETPDVENPGKVVISLAGMGYSIEPGTTVRVAIGLTPLGGDVRNPPQPCTCQLQVDTSAEGDDFGLSAPYDVLEGPGDLLAESGADQQAAVGTDFAAPLAVKLVDGLGDPVAGQTVTFTAPDNGPSGAFAGGDEDGRVFEAVTGGDGVAVSSVLTANGHVGNWQVSVSTAAPDVAPIDIGLRNVAGPAADVALELAPQIILGDGVSQSVATATVTDEFGHPVTGQTVFFTSDGAQAIQPAPATELVGGRYRSTITATPEAGIFTITAGVVAAGFPSDTAALVQTADSAAPRARITEFPPRKSRRARVRFAFEAPADTATLECRLDRRRFRPCADSKAYRVKVGRHVFRVRATDFAGNKGPTAKYRFKRLRRNR